MKRTRQATQEHTAFDYARQVWVTGAEARAILIAQTTDELALLTGPTGDAYLSFIGRPVTRAEAIAAKRAELAAL